MIKTDTINRYNQVHINDKTIYRYRYTLTMLVTPVRLRVASCGGAIQIDYLYLHV